MEAAMAWAAKDPSPRRVNFMVVCDSRSRDRADSCSYCSLRFAACL